MTPTPEERAFTVGSWPFQHYRCDPICPAHRQIADAIRAAEDAARAEDRERALSEAIMICEMLDTVQESDAGDCADQLRTLRAQDPDAGRA